MTNLITYSILLILTVASIAAFVYYSALHKIKLRDILFIVAGTVWVGLTFSTITSGINISDRIAVEFNVPKDIYTDWNRDSLNNPVNEKIFYNHLLLMRAPHAKVMYAQAIHESNHFKSQKFKLLRNCYGMKRSEYRVTTSDQTKGEFKKYKDWQESATDYLFWMFSRNLDTLSDSEYLDFIGKIYAEDPAYKEKIANIIATTDFDKLTK